ncbi:MAG: carboxypeptidase regulatory-like domain-containing protein, partial [Acidobacteriota bacterium]|nr:carboxypeptidase regulatory-like domain-containing protein [Acidobacteriota bacterium]
TMTNEFVFAYTFVGFPNVFEDPAKVDRTKVGYNYKGLFKNGVAQIPSFGNFGGEAALIFNPGGFEAGGPTQGLYANKYMPSISDTLTKVIATHTITGGFFWEWIRNAQPANNNTNGDLTVNAPGNPDTLGDAYADETIGILSSYNETSFNRINDIAYNTYEGFIQDDWKITKPLTLNFGIRLSHLQPWGDRLGDGYSIFDPTKFNPNCASAYCGFLFHKADPSVPVAGFPTRAVFYQPRVGFAYDLGGSGNSTMSRLFGNGATVLRGAWGRYYFHSGQFTNGLDASAGVKSTTLDPVSTPGLVASGLDKYNFAAVASSPSAVDGKNDREPYTDNYNFTVARRLPWSSMLQVAYVGNRTRDIPGSGNGGSTGFNTLNINLVPRGAMLASNNGGVNPNTLNANNFRPLLGYSDLYVATNNAYSNYNSLQVTWVHTAGRISLNLNYTYSKAMGIAGFYDQFNLANNYGVLPSNRTQLFNAAYVINIGNPVHSRLGGAFLNGWTLSGITQLESGANISGLSGQNFGMNLNSANIPGTNIQIIGPQGGSPALLGTTDVQFNPIVTCNPASNLGPHQYVNPNCFAVPTSVGQNGPTVIPPIYGPSYFNSDLGLFKSFQIAESKTLEFRIDGYNFMNHPLWSFPGGNNLSLDFDSSTLKPNNSNFGITTNKQGHRIIQLAVQFMF